MSGEERKKRGREKAFFDGCVQLDALNTRQTKAISGRIAICNVSLRGQVRKLCLLDNSAFIDNTLFQALQ